jgi:DNA-binding CsgD family transcriptional regulator
MDSKDEIYIVGPMMLENSMMASYLVQATGIKCKAVEDASQIPAEKAGIGKRKRLILWDCMGSDAETCLEALSSNDSMNPGRDLLCIFNIPRGGAIETEGLSQGVMGFFYQGDSIDQFMKGIQAILDGELWLSRKIMTRYIMNNHRQSLPPNKGEVNILTPREKQILAMVAQGASNDAISDHLCISQHTVKTHLYRIFRKIHVSNRLQAALWGAKNM